MEQQYNAKVVTYDDRGVERPGGQCGCCGSGPSPHAGFNGGDPWYIYQAGICDADGVYYSMLCGACLEDIRHENAKRPQTERDETARNISELMGDDIDGAQSFMDDLGRC